MRGKSFADRRDAVIVPLLLDTGVRLAEITDVELSDLDMRRQELTVLGEGRRACTVRFGDFTARAVDRCLRIPARHGRAHLAAPWLAERGGAMTSSGVARPSNAAANSPHSAASPSPAQAHQRP